MNKIDAGHFPVWLLFTVLIFFASCAGVQAEETHPVFGKEQSDEFFKKFDAVQKQTNTIQADFVEKKTLTLLSEPVVSSGKFYYTRPSQILWEYQRPDEKKFLLTKNILLSYYPKEKRAEQINIKKFFSKQVFKFFAIGMTSKDLKDLYDIEVSNSNSSKKVLLTLTPKKRSVKKRVEVVKLWVDKITLLPLQLQWIEQNGDTTTLTFEDLKANVEISDSIYKIDFPSDVKITEGFSEFSRKNQGD